MNVHWMCVQRGTTPNSQSQDVMLYKYLLYLKFMKSESENSCGYSKRKGCSKLTEKTIL